MSEAEVITYAASNLKTDSALFVACIGEDVDFGNLIIEVDGRGQTTITAHEHRGFISTGLTAEIAVRALRYWLPMQQKISEISWTEQ